MNMQKQSKLEMNLIDINGTSLKVKHIVYPVLACPVIWALLTIAFSF
tara:strand:+ start:196 stop:336 length:141 start_codon:yes stop_codon:yes gene_type:complete